jgi:hypothetical protein
LGADLSCSLVTVTCNSSGPIRADEALLDRGELRLVTLDVDVHVLQLADPLGVAIDQHLAVPLGDVPPCVLLTLVHRRRLPYLPHRLV